MGFKIKSNKGKFNIFEEHYQYKKQDNLKKFAEKDQEGSKYLYNTNWKWILFNKFKLYDFLSDFGTQGNLSTFICHGIKDASTSVIKTVGQFSHVSSKIITNQISVNN